MKWAERNLFGETPHLPTKQKNVKDTRQREACGCMVSKNIGMYDTCSHFCAYYHTNRKCVMDNVLRLSVDHESLKM